MNVRYNYLPQQFNNPEEIFNEIRELIKTGDFTLGRQVQEFEAKFAKLIGTKHAIGVGSGTDAIKLSLKASGIGPADEVITAANTFVATVGAICEIGAKPVFCDVNDNYVIDAGKIEAAITEKTKAIVPVHFTGYPCDMDKIRELALKHRLTIVEDACQSILAKYKGINCGTFGVAGAFSLHPLKNLNVWADGGMIVTDHDWMADSLRLLRNHGLRDRDHVELMGYNSRLDTIQAIVGNWLIPQAEDITKKRQANARYYNAALSDIKSITIPPLNMGYESVYHLYMFQVSPSARDVLEKYLNDNGIEAKVHYPIPIYKQKALYDGNFFEKTDIQARRLISLPVDQHITREQQDYVIHKIREFFK